MSSNDVIIPGSLLWALGIVWGIVSTLVIFLFRGWMNALSEQIKREKEINKDIAETLEKMQQVAVTDLEIHKANSEKITRLEAIIERLVERLPIRNRN